MGEPTQLLKNVENADVLSAQYYFLTSPMTKPRTEQISSELMIIPWVRIVTPSLLDGRCHLGYVRVH